MFHAEKVFQGVTHISDAMGVSMTLIEGTESAILFDAGYGTENVKAFVQTLTGKPVSVLLSHGHHDHILGVRWFGESRMCSEDLDEFRQRTGSLQRMKVAKQAEQKGVPIPEDFMSVCFKEPEHILFDELSGRFEKTTVELGQMQVQVIHVPGHTPGSIVLYLKELQLLLTGDDWNPCTWIWFPSSLPVRRWRENMKELVRTLEKEHGQEILHVLCSHQPMVRAAEELKAFLEYMDDERLESAPAVDMGVPIETHEIRKEPEGWTLLFDKEKQ